MPQATFTDLNTALTGFQNQVQDYAVQSAISDASKRVQEMQMAGIDEMDRRNQAQQLSSQLALQLTGLGATGTQVQNAFTAIAPKQFNTASDMFGEGIQKDSSSLQQGAQQWKAFDDQNKLRMAELKNQQDALRFNQRQSMQTNTKYLKALENSQNNYNKNIKDTEQNIFKSGIITDALNSKNPTAIQNLAGLIRRQMGDVGPMTDIEQAKVEQLNTLAGKIEAAANYAAGSGAVTPTVQKNIKKLEEQLLSANKGFKQLMLRKHGYQLAKKARVSGYKMNLDEAMQELDAFNSNEENDIAGAVVQQPTLQQPAKSSSAQFNMGNTNITTGATGQVSGNKTSKYIMD